MFSAFEERILSTVDQAIEYENAHKPPRGHLGMSGIAGDAREQWLRFRWSLPEELSARTLRIFSLGNAIEEEILKYLRLAGLEVHSDDGSGQYGFLELGGHYAGSMDGVVRGVPGSSKWHVFEAKSVKAARYKELVKVGVEKWNPVYYGQMQCYGYHAGIERALFAAYNKDTSELYFERVKIDRAYGAAMLEKAREIITGPIPASSYPSRDWYEIKKFKSEHYQRVYWSDELPPRPNCRNCRFSIADVADPEKAAAWGCLKKRVELSLEDQFAGCEEHNFIPALTELPVTEITDDAVTYSDPSRKVQFTNTPTAGENCYTSKELVELSKVNYSAEWIGDPLTQGIRETFNARIDAIQPAGPTW